MSKDPFAAYQLPAGMTEGVKIALPGTPATFMVRLPATMNEDFNMELMSRLQADLDEDGTVKVNAIKFQAERKKMFFDTCILSSSGLPDGMSADDFWAAYPLAAKTVFEKATDLAVKADAEVEESLGKLENSPSGKHSGEVNSISTKNSSKAA